MYLYIYRGEKVVNIIVAEKIFLYTFENNKLGLCVCGELGSGGCLL